MKYPTWISKYPTPVIISKHLRLNHSNEPHALSPLMSYTFCWVKSLQLAYRGQKLRGDERELKTGFGHDLGLC